jgi:hypothetical protein
MRKDSEVRRYISKAEVARCSFKKKVIEDVEVLEVYLFTSPILTPTEAIFRGHQNVIESVGKSLRIFAENQQYRRARYFFCTLLMFVQGNVLAM